MRHALYLYAINKAITPITVIVFDLVELVMNTFAPLFSLVVKSSIWDEDDATCKVWVTMMALKDADHVVRLTAYQLGRECRKTEQEVLDALLILASPDRKRIEPQEFEGRRIKKVEDGWLVLNGQKYKEMMMKETLRAKNRRGVEAFRLRQKLGIPQFAGAKRTEPVNGEKGIL